MSKPIACVACTLKLEISGQDVTAMSSFTLSPGSANIKEDGNALYTDKIAVIVSACAYNSYNLVAPCTVNITGTGENAKIDGKASVLEKDYGQADGTFLNSSEPHDTQSFSIKATVDVAGQTKTLYLS